LKSAEYRFLVFAIVSSSRQGDTSLSSCPKSGGQLTVLVAVLAAASGLAALNDTAHARDVAAPAARLIAPETHVAGDRLAITLEGLTPGSVARVSATRRFGRWMQDTGGNWVEVLVLLDSWAEYRVPGSGRVDLNTSRPVRGTWRRADARDLLWSGEPVETFDRQLPQSSADVVVQVTVSGREIARHVMRLEDGRPGLVRTSIDQPGFSAAYAAPAGPGPHPVLIVLHGSEGGDRDMAAISAARFATQGYATLALNYFAWPHKGMTNIPTRHVEVPVELLEQARAWLAARPEADLERIGLWGVSKGAEFAALAASQYRWIDAAVACVASDVVWEGYGRDPQPQQPVSSWSIAGQALPFVSTPALDPTGQRWATNTARYEAAWQAQTAAARAAAAIPIERAAGRFLFIGADRDEVWASGRMVRSAMARLRRFSRAGQAEALIFERSGHMICGDGVYPGRVYGTQRPDRRAKSLMAEGEDQLTAWDRTLDFLARELKPATGAPITAPGRETPPPTPR
jgi:dienelactone hydrolase